MYTVYSIGAHGGIHKIYYHLHFHHSITMGPNLQDGVVVHCLNNPQREGPPATDQTLAPANPMSQMMGAAAPAPNSGALFWNKTGGVLYCSYSRQSLCVLKMLYHVCGIYDDHKILLKVYPATKWLSRL